MVRPSAGFARSVALSAVSVRVGVVAWIASTDVVGEGGELLARSALVVGSAEARVATVVTSCASVRGRREEPSVTNTGLVSLDD